MGGSGGVAAGEAGEKYDLMMYCDLQPGGNPRVRAGSHCAWLDPFCFQISFEKLGGVEFGRLADGPNTGGIFEKAAGAPG